MQRAIAILLLWFAGTATVFADPPAVDPAQLPADELFQTAMKFELDGENDYREMTLRAALAKDVDHAKAHWHLGEIATDGKWRPVADLVTSTNPIVTEYGERRQQSLGDPRSELALAKWCRANKLSQREQLHLVRVVANPQTEPALRGIAARRLKLKNIDGLWMTEEQLAAIRRREAQSLADYKKWAPKLAKWRDVLANGSERKREEAKAAVTGISDPAAVLALEYELAGSSEEAALLVIQALGNIQHHDASLSLVRLALRSLSPRVVDAASRQLKFRPMHEYVPVLLNKLDTPIQIVSSPTRLNAWDNTTAQQQVFFKEGIDANQMFILNRQATTRQINLPPVHYVLSERRGNDFASGERQLANQPELREAIDNNTSLDAGKLQQELDSINRDLNADRASANLTAAAAINAARAKQAIAQVDAANQQIAAVNARTVYVLRQTTGEILPDNATNWWDWWHSYNEVSPPSAGYDGYPYPSRDHKPTVVSSYISAQLYAYESQPVSVKRLSCFVAGTPVWTDTGIRPVEDVLIGDRVLAMNPDSGELGFTVVLEHTRRPPSEIMRIGFADESIACTNGHPFWVNGAGWKMAKELAGGDRIHGLRGANTVVSVTRRTAQDQAHNLVVAGMGTYLVGQSGLLVHDNTYRAPTQSVVPGYAPDQRLVAK